LTAAPGVPPILFFCVGAEKSATSWLDGYFVDHPEVATPEFKEVNYWNTIRPPHVTWALKDFENRHKPKLGIGRRLFGSLARGKLARRTEARRRLSRMFADSGASHEAYMAVLTQNRRGRDVVGEVCPGYADLEPDTFAEIAGLGPDVRFLFLMRDPVARAVSSAQMQLWLGNRWGYEGNDPDGYLSHLLSEVPEAPPLRFSRYERTLQNLERGAPDNPLLCLFYESLFDRGQPEVDRVTAFLGVGQQPGNFGAVRNAARNPTAGIGDDLAARLRREFDGTYSFIRARFGDTCPQDWLW
jgi:hypothetical protein